MAATYTIEAAHRTSLAKGEVGIREKRPVPTMAEFCEKRFEPWARSSTSSKTWLDYYRPGLRAIQRHKPLASLKLDEVTSERAADFAAWRQSQGLQVSSVNSSLQVLRRVLHLAADWGWSREHPRSNSYRENDTVSMLSVRKKRLVISQQHANPWPRSRPS